MRTWNRNVTMSFSCITLVLLFELTLLPADATFNPAELPKSIATSGRSSDRAEDNRSGDRTIDETAPKHGSSAATDPPQTASDTPLKGTINKIELDLGVLRDIGLDLKHILKATSSLYEEVTIQPVDILTEPEIIGPGTIVYIPIGTMPVGVRQPARKERVDLAMNEIAPMVTLLKKNVDEFVSGEKQLDLPSDVLCQLEPQIQKWVQMVDQAYEQLTRLKQITQKPPYDNDAIASSVTNMQSNIKQLDKARREIYKVIRKEGKRIAEAKQQ